MNEHLINLAGTRYWAFVMFALVVYIPLSGGWLRPWMSAVLNLLFLRMYITGIQFWAVVATVIAVFTISKLLIRDRLRTAAFVLLALPTAALFALHKFPALEFLDRSHAMINVLSTIGFSYVALRIADLLRTVYECRSAPPSLPDTVNYLLPFHMLAAGPIQAFDDFIPQSAAISPQTSIQTLRAVERIALGVFKKYVVAMILQSVFLTGFTIPGWYVAWEAQIFYIWLYLDFSALSDIAIGIGSLLGIATPENFNRPYCARNLIDFWERWHISLSQFIRRNVFIPIQLGLVRRSAGARPLLCSSIAFSIAFTLCGLWHQGTLRYLVWGGVHAFGLIVTNVYRDQLIRRIGSKGVKQYLANPWFRVAAGVITFEFVAFSLVLISAPFEALFP